MCVSVCLCVDWECGVGSLKGERVLGAEKEVSVHVVLQGILVTLGWEALLTNRTLLPWRGGRAPSAGLCQGTHSKATRERQRGKERVNMLCCLLGFRTSGRGTHTRGLPDDPVPNVLSKPLTVSLSPQHWKP